MIAARVPAGLLLVTAGLVFAQTPAPNAPQAQTPPAPSAPVAQNPGAQPAAAAPAPTLGRLFFTPADRAMLDDMRRRPVAAPVQEPKQQAPAPEYVTLNGVVRRSDGSTTVWLNNKPVQGGRTSDGVVIAPARAATPGNVTVHVPQTGRSVDLKVGQQLEVTSGKVQEPYRVPPPAAAAAGTTTAPTAAAGGTAPADAAPERTTPRRSSRERDMLRDLLREIDGPPAGQGPPSEPAKNPASTQGAPG